MLYAGNIKAYRFYLYSLLFLSAGWVWLLLNTSSAIDGIGVCWFKKLTTVSCPACGSTSSAEAILSGRWAEAFFINPLGYPILAALIVLPLWLIADIVSGKTTAYQMYAGFDRKIKQKPVLFIFILLLIAANWIWNIYKQ